MPSPAGSVPALSGASATIFSIGIVFLGYWGMYEPTGWRVVDIFVFAFALIGSPVSDSCPGWPRVPSSRTPATRAFALRDICFSRA
jgi:hypothetical protein